MKKLLLIPSILTIGLAPMVSVVNCGDPDTPEPEPAEEIIATWKNGEPFVPTVPTKEFKDDEGTFDDADTYLIAYHEDISKKPLIYAEDFLMNISKVPNIDQISTYEPKIGDVKNKEDSNGIMCNNYFTISIDFLFSGHLTKDSSYKEFKMSYTNIPISLTGTGQYDNDLCPLESMILNDSTWSVTIPEITKCVQTEFGYEFEFGQNSISYNKEKLNILGEGYWEAIGLIFSVFLRFKSTYFENAFIDVTSIQNNLPI